MPTGTVAFAFGTPKELESNRQIGAVASATGNPIYSQEEVPLGPELDVTYIEGSEVPTLRIARGALSWAQKRGLRSLRVVCAEPHAWRCMRDMRAAAKETGFRALIYLAVMPHMKWFLAESLQPRTRNRLAWYPRELLLRFVPFGIYAKVAS